MPGKLQHYWSYISFFIPSDLASIDHEDVHSCGHFAKITPKHTTTVLDALPPDVLQSTPGDMRSVDVDRSQTLRTLYCRIQRK